MNMFYVIAVLMISLAHDQAMDSPNVPNTLSNSFRFTTDLQQKIIDDASSQGITDCGASIISTFSVLKEDRDEIEHQSTANNVLFLFSSKSEGLTRNWKRKRLKSLFFSNTFMKHDLIIVKDKWDFKKIKSARSSKLVWTYFSDIDNTFDKVMELTAIIERKGKIIPLIIQYFVSINNASKLNDNFSELMMHRLNEKYSINDYKLAEYKHAIRFIQLASKLFETTNVLTAYPAQHRNIFKEIILDFWYLTFEELFKLKMNQFMKTLADCLFLTDQERQKIHNTVSDAIDDVTKYLYLLYRNAKTYYQHFDGNEIGLNSLHTVRLTGLVDTLSVFKIDLNVAHMIEIWKTIEDTPPNGTIAVDLRYTGNSRTSTFLHLLGFQEDNIHTYDVVPFGTNSRRNCHLKYIQTS